jgi:hypothetical protein
MKTAFLQSKSDKSMELLIELAKKLGIKTTLLSEEELEDLGMIKAIKKGRTGKFIDKSDFIKSLK